MFSQVLAEAISQKSIQGLAIDLLPEFKLTGFKSTPIQALIKESFYKVKKTPKPHQYEALSDIKNGMLIDDRGAVVMACGSGKTLISLWAAEQSGCKTLLVLVPSLALVSQLLNEWVDQTSWINYKVICVCSDDSVSEGIDEVYLSQSDFNCPVTTDSYDIHEFMLEAFDGVKIVFSTYQSARTVADGVKFDDNVYIPPFDLAIFDEAHKTANVGSSLFNFALDNENLPIRKRIFFTATPKHYKLKNGGHGDLSLAYSMDNESIYGKVLHKLSVRDAVLNGIICDYKIIVSVVTTGMVDDYTLSHGEVDMHGHKVNARQVAMQVALQEAVKKYGIKKIFTFHSSVAKAESFTAMNGTGLHNHLTDFETFHVSGAMSTALRAQKMKAFKDADQAAMSNARCLTEGVDVPGVDLVGFMDRKKSQVDTTQAAGRAMRKDGDKEFGYIFVPVFIDQAENESLEAAIERTDYGDVFHIINAMREQDELIAEIIIDMSKKKGCDRLSQYVGTEFKDRIEIIGPQVSLDVIQRSVTTKCLEAMGSEWYETLGQYQSYLEAYNTAYISQKDNPELHKWQESQRYHNAYGTLSEEHKLELNAIGFIWNIDEAIWLDNLEEHKLYILRAGAEQSHRVACAWAVRQRIQKRKNALSESKIAMLDAIGFVWEISDVQWLSKINETKSYLSSENKDQIPRSIYVWMLTQRNQRNKGLLSIERISQLDAIGFVWDTEEAEWLTQYEAYQHYIKASGSNYISAKGEYVKLYYWASTQRKIKNKGLLSVERVALLDDLFFVWDVVMEVWLGNLDDYRSYITLTGFVNMIAADNEVLYAWCVRQRKQRNKGLLSKDQVAILDELGFIWDIDAFNWMAQYNDLVSIKARTGSALVSSRGTTTKLYDWSLRQRKQHALGQLTKARIVLLEAIGFSWYN